MDASAAGLSEEHRAARFRRFIAVCGPGLLVMLADTDVGSIVTAAQSGVGWGYRLLLLQFLLIPVLYVVQELTVRLGIYTGKGHGELIREIFGPGWAWLSVSGLGIATIGALLTEFSGLAAVGEVLGLPRGISLALVAAFMLVVVWSGSYRRVELVALLVGLFEFVFFWVAYAAHPQAGELAGGLLDIPVANTDYLYLVAANIGAVIMPWMIFFQQSAVADKRLRPEHLASARLDTAIGAVVTQLVMAAVLVACAATIGKAAPGLGTSLTSVGALADALTPFLGLTIGRLVFCLGVTGAAIVAAIVASLACAWGFGEVAGYRRSLEHHPLDAPWFYGVYTVAVVGGAVIVAVVPDLVTLNLAVEVTNALMLPLVLGFLVALAIRALPPEQRLRGLYCGVVIAVAALTAGLGVYGGMASLF
jgi:NRAMP (natural resistance-associated macrophage protein)-like metal ion transporter